MNKNWYQSKTIWGFGVAALILLLQNFGWVDQTALTEALKTLSGFFGLYGLRDSVS